MTFYYKYCIIKRYVWYYFGCPKSHDCKGVLFMNNTTASLHSKEESGDIWDGLYKNPLARAEAAYRASHLLFDTMLTYSREYRDHDFGVSTVYENDQIKAVKKEMANKGLAFASTLFSAINSLPGLLTWKEKFMIFELREVIRELLKHENGNLTPSHKEVLVACFMLLEKKLRWQDANAEFWSSLAKKYIEEILSDEQVSLATKMLTYARASSLSSLPAEKRLEYKGVVLGFLYDIRAMPSNISTLAQEWKTYVRLARMVYSWGDMIFGLRRDKSLDLHVKSYLFFCKNFYKT